MTNYKAALNEILAELSKGLEHKFPPADYQSPVSYESLRHEDIEPEDSVLVTSAGAAVRSPLSNQTLALLTRVGIGPRCRGALIDGRHHFSSPPMKGQP